MQYSDTRWRERGALLVSLALVVPILAPQALAFPYHARIGADEVWNEAPLPTPALRAMLARKNALVATSPLAQMPEGRHIFLTQGRWRWRWLAAGSSDALGLTRAMNEAIIINRGDQSRRVRGELLELFSLSLVRDLPTAKLESATVPNHDSLRAIPLRDHVGG